HPDRVVHRKRGATCSTSRRAARREARERGVRDARGSNPREQADRGQPSNPLHISLVHDLAILHSAISKSTVFRSIYLDRKIVFSYPRICRYVNAQTPCAVGSDLATAVPAVPRLAI